MGSYIRTSSFHTFDPIRLSPESLIGPINESMDGKHGDLLRLVEGYNVMPELKEGEPSPIDRATSLFISVLDWQDDGGAPRSLDGGHSRERLGRFPSNDGNAIEYLIEYTVERKEETVLQALILLVRGFVYLEWQSSCSARSVFNNAQHWNDRFWLILANFDWWIAPRHQTSRRPIRTQVTMAVAKL